MVQCDQCQDWFYDECVTVHSIVWKGDNISWLYKPVLTNYNIIFLLNKEQTDNYYYYFINTVLATQYI